MPIDPVSAATTYPLSLTPSPSASAASTDPLSSAPSSPLDDGKSCPAPKPPTESAAPKAQPDSITRAQPNRTNDYRDAIQKAYGGAVAAAPLAGAAVAKAAPKMVGAASKFIGGPISGVATVLTTPTQVGDADESNPGAAWHQHSNAASDQATWTAAHSAGSSTTVRPAEALRGVQHTGYANPTVSKGRPVNDADPDAN